MKKILLFLLSLCLLLSSVGSVAFASEDKIYICVSSNANENGDGSIANPFSNIEAARDEIRRLREEGENPAEGFVVYLRGGNYGLDKGIVFDAKDGGTSEAPIVYASYPGEKATLIGGASIDAKYFVPLNNEEIRERVIDETARTKIIQIDLGALGYTDFGENRLRGVYSYIAPLPTQTPANAPDLSIDGELMTLARYPNKGNMIVKEIIKEGFDSEGTPEQQAMSYEEGFIISPQDERIKYWTLDPEREGAEDFAKECQKRGIVLGICYSDAPIPLIEKFTEYGLNLGSHIMCATGAPKTMFGGTKEPGSDEYVLVSDDMYAEVIADSMGAHVRPLNVKLIYKIKGYEKIIIMTDCCTGGDDMGSDVNIINGQLYGSQLTMNVACRNMKKYTNAPIWEIFKMAAENPAKATGIFEHHGSLETGKIADIVVVDDDFNIKDVVLQGKLVDFED